MNLSPKEISTVTSPSCSVISLLSLLSLLSTGLSGNTDVFMLLKTNDVDIIRVDIDNSSVIINISLPFVIRNIISGDL